MKMRMAVGIVAAALAVGMLSGCAAFKKGPTPEEMVMQRTQAFTNDFLACKSDTILDYVSESFTNDRVASKKEIAEHLQKAKDSGKLAQAPDFLKEHNGQIDLKAAKVTVKKDVATVYPITASANEGSVTVELTWKKDPDKVWRISGINIEGI